MAVASAGLYASLHLISDNHANIPPLSFLQAGCPSCRPTNSVKALKAYTTSAIYHPNSNGQAERFVAIFKHALKTMQSDKTSLDTKTARFLIIYRTGVNSSTGEIPSVFMTGRRLHTRLDLVKPTEQNYKLKPNHSERQFNIGQAVAVRDYRARTNKWIPGILSDKHGHLMYSVRISSPSGSVTFKRHVDQIIPRQNAVIDLDTSVMDQDIPTATSTMNQGPSNQQPPLPPPPPPPPPPPAVEELPTTSSPTPSSARHRRTSSILHKTLLDIVILLQDVP